MIETLSGFFEALRSGGLDLSPAEAIDATRAVAALGVESKETMQAALRLACAKDRTARDRFDRVFEGYFLAPEPGKSWERRGRGESGDGQGRGSRRGGDDATFARSAPLDSRPHEPRSRRGERRSGTEPQLLSLLREGARSPRSRLRRLLLDRPRPGTGMPSAPARASAAPRDAESRSASLRRRDLRAPAAAAVEQALIDEVRKMVAAIRLREGRRWERGRRGRIALRRTLRESLATGAVPFVLARETRRLRRPRVVLLLDLSHSVERASGLFLRLAAQFLTEVARTRVFAFVDRPVECTHALLPWARRSRGNDLDGALVRVEGLDRSQASDHGRVFYALGGQPGLRGRDLVLVVLADGRNNRFDAQGWAFADLARRARTVLWLVPEGQARWGTGDSALGEYLPHADIVVECADLAGLGRGFRELRRVTRGRAR